MTWSPSGSARLVSPKFPVMGRRGQRPGRCLWTVPPAPVLGINPRVSCMPALPLLCFILLGCFGLGKIPWGGQRPGVLERLHTSGGIWISLCLCLAGLVHWCTVLGLCKSLVYYGRLLLHRLGIPGGQARMSTTGCVPGSLAAGLSTAQGT